MKDLLPKIKPILIGLGLSAIASIITIGLHSYNIFDTLEYKLYDFKFQLRGPTAGDLSLNPISNPLPLFPVPLISSIFHIR